jgi:hypothetical protein
MGRCTCLETFTLALGVAAKEVVTEMKESWNLVLKQCIAKTVIHMLPWFAVASCHETTHDEAFKKKVSHATACYGLLTKEATKG